MSMNGKSLSEIFRVWIATTDNWNQLRLFLPFMKKNNHKSMGPLKHDTLCMTFPVVGHHKLITNSRQQFLVLYLADISERVLTKTRKTEVNSFWLHSLLVDSWLYGSVACVESSDWHHNKFLSLLQDMSQQGLSGLVKQTPSMCVQVQKPFVSTVYKHTKNCWVEKNTIWVVFNHSKICKS